MCVFQHASNLEQKQNETENKKVHGDVVKYGTVIQVNNLFIVFTSMKISSVVGGVAASHMSAPSMTENKFSPCFVHLYLTAGGFFKVHVYSPQTAKGQFHFSLKSNSFEHRCYTQGRFSLPGMNSVLQDYAPSRPLRSPKDLRRCTQSLHTIS